MPRKVLKTLGHLALDLCLHECLRLASCIVGQGSEIFFFHFFSSRQFAKSLPSAPFETPLSSRLSSFILGQTNFWIETKRKKCLTSTSSTTLSLFFSSSLVSNINCFLCEIFCANTLTHSLYLLSQGGPRVGTQNWLGHDIFTLFMDVGVFVCRRVGYRCQEYYRVDRGHCKQLKNNPWSSQCCLPVDGLPWAWVTKLNTVENVLARECKCTCWLPACVHFQWKKCVSVNEI